MKFLYDFFPILFFFIAYKVADIFVATAVAILASLAQVLIYRIQHHRYEKMHLITLAIVIIFGGMTLVLHDETFIKWKPTLIDFLFAGALIASQFIGEKNLIQRMLETAVQVTSTHVWLRLNIAWAGFFLSMGLLNLYVAFHFSTDTWVNFKLFGMMGLTIVFIVFQSIYLARYIDESTPEVTE
ncbi:septation protein A [Beggiatoa leptomitoformis]|uniref:Inner membrane-spanning protein YciB n=1 Tax=Beggiatoa leptomitoformis TaxID=288004 RepID=A0A2N9YDE0_9GAMM|nr:septation protein A [Beggiatoa leptomitoformis]ALG69103.1 septation protein A [Beggiatoa leptomitoformis]AUI68484.1 septation protein A [Beggiatoa leptomitoformis]